jgi:hypothetical protein
MEYLSGPGAIQSAQNLASPDHESFDANTAILLGLVVMEDHVYPLVSAPDFSNLGLLDKVLIFNKLAEESTGSAQIALLSAFDRTMNAGFTALVKRYCHLDHDHEVSCCSRSPGFETMTRTDADSVYKFEKKARRFALNPYHTLIPKFYLRLGKAGTEVRILVMKNEFKSLRYRFHVEIIRSTPMSYSSGEFLLKFERPFLPKL